MNTRALGNVLLALVCGNVRLVVSCNLRVFLFNFNNLLLVKILLFRKIVHYINRGILINLTAFSSKKFFKVLCIS